MKQLLGTAAFPAALLLLLAPGATGASVVPPTSTFVPAPQQPRASYKALQGYPAAPVDAAEQEEEENQDVEQDGGQLPWYKMLPRISQQQLEQMGKATEDMPYIAGLRDSWNAVKGQVRDFQPGQLQEAFENVKRLTASSVGAASQSSAAKFMKEFFEDPETRIQLAHVLLGMLGMATAGMVLNDSPSINDAAATAVYVLVLSDLYRNWSQVVQKLATRVGENDSFKQSMAAVREKLAGLVSSQNNNDESADGSDEVDTSNRQTAMNARMREKAPQQTRERAAGAQKVQERRQ